MMKYQKACIATIDLWDRLDFHLRPHVKSPLELRYASSKSSIIERALRQAVIDLLDDITVELQEYIENETAVISTQHQDTNIQSTEIDDEIDSLAPTVFSQLREDIDISNKQFRQ
ncbi:unnamed protein product [Rotaria socialis]|uniref:Uncharacterized protein n=1 Tax=Rotaria socialis TaxID=392032 RepID=A0A818Q0R0_9BILA|nr:unnamed protein product [Rotaria socialis]